MMINNKKNEEKNTTDNKRVLIILVSLVIGIVILGVVMVKGINTSLSLEPSGGNSRYSSSVDSSTRVDPVKAGVDYYLEKYGEGIDESQVEGRVKNFGCHSEIHIYVNDKLTLKLSYSGGQIYEV